MPRKKKSPAVVETPQPSLDPAAAELVADVAREAEAAPELASKPAKLVKAPKTPKPKPLEPLVIWAVSDGRAGIEAQVLGIAEAVARRVPAVIERKHVTWKGRLGRLPWWAHLFPRKDLAPESGIAPPWPDLWVAAGRATLPLSIRAKRWSGGKTFVVQAQDPRVPIHMFDLVAPPKHDRLTGDNVISITGAPHRVTPARLEAEYPQFAEALDPLPRPRVAVLIGGKSRGFDLPPERAAAIANDLQFALEQEGGSLMMTFSRRTPEPAKALLTARLRALPGVIWNGEGENPYFAFLAAADYILVTEDSANMATEAAATGKPVFILKMDGQSLKFGLFHEELERHGAARPFGGAFHGWTYTPLAETDRLAGEVLKRMGKLPEAAEAEAPSEGTVGERAE